VDKLTVPDAGKGCQVIASVSGGKDSAALVLALREAEIPALYVFADTNWEHPETYKHVDTMRRVLGIDIAVVGHPGGMVAKAEKRAGFPTRMARWCTDELKIREIRKYHNDVIDATGQDTICAVGVRAEESQARAALPAWGVDKEWDGFVWRPLLHWTVQDVIEIHRRHGLPMNPLYHMGYDRVGCYPCIYASKAEIARIALDSPERIAEIESMESRFSGLRVERNAEAAADGKDKPRYAHETATFFQSRDAKTMRPMGIRELADWATTDRGGRQRVLFDPAPRGGCMRWGLCEVAPPKDD
jgi:3'-phosphoadenosine 5'-phosphosulfate sulfotransferase (PAPS reductase)/FAD synthetase